MDRNYKWSVNISTLATIYLKIL